MEQTNGTARGRFSVLDGWRGLAILFVLAGHLLPLGPKSWQINSAIAGAGMVIFFNLSGFLIANILLQDQNVFRFLVRRFMRIVPLAWLVLLVTMLFLKADAGVVLPHVLLYANWGNPMPLTAPTSHFWSLCVEAQFYGAIAGLVLLFRKGAFVLVPVCCAAITCLRWFYEAPMAINTYFRGDEILAGCILALLYKNNSEIVIHCFRKLNPVYMFPLVILSAHPEGGWFMYLRPYVSMLLVGSTLFREDIHWWRRVLSSQFLFYIASISYALYVIHGGLRYSWLGEGELLERYMKRPLLIGVTFILAHFSTFYYEKYWINLGKRIIKKKH